MGLRTSSLVSAPGLLLEWPVIFVTINTNHSKSKINMDVNEVLQYSFAVWHD